MEAVPFTKQLIVLLPLYCMLGAFGAPWFKKRGYVYGFFLLMAMTVAVVGSFLNMSIGGWNGVIAEGIFVAIVALTMRHQNKG